MKPTAAEQRCRDLLALLREPSRAGALALPQWEVVVRLARQARLLATLDARLHEAEQGDRIPAVVSAHLTGARNLAALRQHHLERELAALAEALPADVPTVLLKGCAYVVTGARIAVGRMPSDVDILVAPADLARTEAVLLAAGWRFDGVLDAHDVRYYRDWSHELPPLRRPGQPLEVDLHHAISPPVGRTPVDAAALLRAAVAVPGTRWQVLQPHDQILHAAIHLFQDSELSDGLRDIVDIAGLLHEHVTDEAALEALRRRAEELQVSAMLEDALFFVERWLPSALRLSPRGAWMTQVRRVFAHAALPLIPGRPPRPAERVAATYGRLRYQWRRMPFGMLVRHRVAKALRTLRRSG